jgi:cell division protein FtsB
MKKLTILTVLLLVSLAAWSQVDLSNALGTLDITKVNMSNAAVELQGPVDLYIKGIKYMGQSYAAILKYDGKGNFEVVAPAAAEMATPKYDSLDVSKMEVIKPTSMGGVITLKGIIVDGYSVTVDVKVDTAKLMKGDIVFTAASAPVVTAMTETNPAAMDALKAKNAELLAQITELESDVDTAEDEVAALEAKYAEGEAMYYALLAKSMGAVPISAEGARTLFVDLSTMQSFGKWAQSNTGIAMTDPKAAFAKFQLRFHKQNQRFFITSLLMLIQLKAG